MDETSNGYRILDHTADVGIEARGRDLARLFTNAARGMLSLMADTASVRPERRVEITVEEEGLEDLLVAWLGEILFVSETRLLVFHDVRVTEADETSVRGELSGEHIDSTRHDLGSEIKAVTYHDCRVVHDGDGWTATVLFDI